jgi:hypothetical protein
MKKTTLLVTLLVTLLASTALQAKEYVFVAKGTDSISTELCKTAGESGISAANRRASDLGVSPSKFRNDFTCNGISPAKFARKYKTPKADVEIEAGATKMYDFVASDKEQDTNVCILAVKGEVSSYKRGIACNGMPIHRFISKYKA